MKKNGLIVAILLAVTISISGCGSVSSSVSELPSGTLSASVSTSSETSVSQSQSQITENTTQTSTPEALVSASAETEPEPEPEVIEVTPPELTLIMVGDMLLHDRLEDYALKDNGVYDYSSFFTHTKDLIEGADVALVNQEVILGGSELKISGYPRFNAPYEFGDELVEAGFDVILHATNHALDKNKAGLLNCMNYWNTNHPEIFVVGINETKEDYTNVSVYESNGFKIAILNYTYSTNGISAPDDMPYIVDMLDKEKVIADIKWAEENTDFTIVCPHWGTEYSLTTSSSQKNWTKIFLENGVDLVIGTHPHVIEPIEWLENEETGEKMLVYYSLGNYINWTGSTGAGCADRMVGGMAQVTLQKSEEGKVSIVEDNVTPLICHLSKEEGELSVYPLSEYSKELADENLARNIDSSFSYEYCVNLVNRVWGDYYESLESR